MQSSFIDALTLIDKFVAQSGIIDNKGNRFTTAQPVIYV